MERCSELLEQLINADINTRIDVARRSAILITELSYQCNSTALGIFNAAIDAYAKRDALLWTMRLQQLRAVLDGAAKTA